LKLVEAGFDVIDINFGCPVKKVLGRCRGGYHLSQPDVALEIIRRTRDIVPGHIPVTVKMRRGIDDSSASRDNFFAILEGDGVILGSGDLFTAQDCLDMIAQTGVDGVTIARGAIGNPWIFAQARALARGEPLPAAPSLHEQREVIREHYRLAEQLYDAKRCGILMRKFGIKYSAMHPQNKEVRDSFSKVRCREDWAAVLDRWYADDLPGCHPDPSLHRSQAEGDCGQAA
jgi:tRNA-dihydrouridine synthase